MFPSIRLWSVSLLGACSGLSSFSFEEKKETREKKREERQGEEKKTGEKGRGKERRREERREGERSTLV